MFRKAFKSLYVFALMIFALGAIFLIPSLSNKKSTKADGSNLSVSELSEVDNSQELLADSDSNLWSDALVNVSSMDLSSDTIKIDRNSTKTLSAYKIGSATDLAYFAYAVNNNIGNYRTATYVLTADINLEGAIWTPIGTTNNSFAGIFIGQGFCISNINTADIAIDTASDSVGLFGTISGSGSVSDLRIGGTFFANTTKANVGALVGNNAGEIINCFDETTSKQKYNNGYTNVNAIGSNSGKVYTGLAYFDTNGGEHSSNKGISSGSGNVVGYYVITDNGTFRIANGDWYELKRVRVCISNNSVATTTNMIYSNSAVVLRENANSGNVYPLRTGYKYTIPNPKQGRIELVAGNPFNTNVTFNYQYGSPTNRSHTVSVPYDSTFQAILASYSFLNQRSGFNFNGIYSDANYNEGNKLTETGSADYKKCYVNSNQTVYPKFTAKGNLRYEVIFAIAAGDKSNQQSAYDQVTGAIASVTSLTSQGNDVKNKYWATAGVVNNTNQSTFTVTLKQGYRLATVVGSGGTITDNVANVASGVYVNFNVTTGTGNSYTVNNTNNDAYLPVSASISGDGTYTITVTNIAGANGQIYLVVERKTYSLTFVPEYVDGVSEGSSVTLSGQGYNISGLTLNYKINERYNLTLKVGGDFVILNSIKATNPNLAENFITATATGTSYGGTIKYYQSYIYNIYIEGEANAVNREVVVKIGYIQSRINVVLKDENGSAIDLNTLGKGLGIIVNADMNDDDVNWVASGQQTVLFHTNSDITDVITSKNNGHYIASSVKIDGVSVGLGFTNVDNQKYYSTLSQNNLITKIYNNDNPSETIIQIEVFYRKQTYGLNVKFKVKKTEENYGSKPEDNIFNGNTDLYNVTINGQPTLNTSNITGGTKFTVRVELTTRGKAILYGNGNLDCVANIQGTTTGTTEDVNNGFIGSSVSANSSSTSSGNGIWVFDVTVGTYDTDVVLHFNYKKLTMQVNQMYVDNSENSLTGQLLNLNTATSSTFNFQYSDGNISLEGTFGSIEIHSQYYLLDWYLKNGEFVNIGRVNAGNYADITTNGNILTDIIGVSAKSVNTPSVTYSNVAAYVVKRTIQVTLTSGNPGFGQIYYNGAFQSDVQSYVASSGLTYGTELSLNSNIFKNLGYTFASWNVSWADGSQTQITNGKLLITDKWYAFFGGSQYTNWSVLCIGTTEKQYQKTSSISLSANWTNITYHISFDGVSTSQIQLGQELKMEVDENAKDGFADYKINGQVSTGSGRNGYIAVSATISAIGGSGVKDITETNGFTFVPANTGLDDAIKKILTEAYYFSANSQDKPIMVTTNREAANYRIYIDGSSAGYYSVAWNGNESALGGVDNGNVYINVTFDTKPDNIKKALDAGNLVITRTGYGIVQNSWKRTTGSMIDTNNIFNITTDIHVVPVWTKTSNTTGSRQNWASDVGSINKFYLYNEHDVLNGFITGSNIGSKTQPEINYILTNGEKITDFGYEITFTPKGGGTASNSVISGLNLNISNFLKAGTYQVIFYVNVSDTLSDGISYTSRSGVSTFTMEQNEIVFYGNDIHSYYTGTNEFVNVNEGDGGVNTEFGSFLYKYDWNGNDLSIVAGKTEIGEVEDYFNNMSIFEADGNYNVGGNKSLKLYLNIGALGNKYGEIYSDLFSNVTKDGNNYYTYLNTDTDSFVTIEKAKFTITFTSGSAYYFEGVTTIVWTNTSKHQFTSGLSTFTYGYDNITLHEGAQPGTYQGAENHDTDITKFIINGLYIEGHESDLNSNFEWNINKGSSFVLLDSKNAIQYNYSPKYLVASGGILAEGLANNYLQKDETLSIVNVMVNGSAVSIPNDAQYSHRTDDNKVLFSFVNNNTNSLRIYINNDLLSSRTTLSFGVQVNLSTERSKTLSIISWGNSLDSASYEALFNSAFTATNPYTVTVAANSENKTTYAVMTDVVKLNLDYNGGKKDGKTSETIYLSAMNGNLDVTNPTHDYAGLSFNNYSAPKTSNITVTVSDGKNVIKTVKGGQAENLKASWNFNNIVATQTQTALTKKASVGGFDLGLNEFTNITYPDKTTNKSYTLAHDSMNFNFNSADNTFKVVNANNLAEVSMSGDYVLNVSVTYSDGVQNPQTRTLTYTLNLTIEINTVGITKDNSHLTFNNTNQAGNVTVDLYLNGAKNGSSLLSNLPSTNNSGSGRGFYVTINSTKGYTTINQADTYTVSAHIDSSLTGVYALESGKESITVVVDQDIINLKDYQDQINLSKVFGTADPSPISTTLTIKENANDTVKVEFTRDLGSGSEAIGQHLLTFSKISLAEDEANYDVNADGFEDYFEITVPETKLQVNLGAKLTYTYNGYQLTNLTVEFNGTNYTLKGTAGSQNVEVKFDMYYMAGTSRVEIPQDQKAVYAGYVTFASANANKKAGTYDFNVSLSSSAQGGWSGVEIVNTENAKIVVEKRTITLTGATKTFDQTNQFVYNNTSTAGNTATLVIDNIVTVGDVTDQIQVSGQFAQEFAGQQNITNKNLDNVGDYENYILTMTSGLKILVNPSTEQVDVTSSVNSLVYGTITSGTSISQLLGFVPISYNGGKINNIYITAESYNITDKQFSTGNYLNVKTWDFVYTMSSTNYTFGDSVGSVGQKYSKTYTLSITITPVAITINNAQGKTITKQYDGYANVLAGFVNQNVNASDGYYTSSGILTGDVITVVSASYENEKIGNGKVVTATLSGDNNNYTITQNIYGNITNVALIFNKYLETTAWVDDGIDEFGNADALHITYTGDLDAVINTIIAVSSRATRVGYTQTGWTYQNVNMASVDFDKESFLQDAVDNKSVGITINAVWEINKYTVTVDSGANTVVSHDSVTFPKEVNYWDTISDIKVNANEGYTFENVTLNPNNATLSMTGQATNKGTFTLTHITGNLTATIVSEEITVRIIIDYNNPESFIVDTNSAGWTGGIKDRVLKYSELSSSSQDLPVLYVTTPNTYDFDEWTNVTGNTSLGANIWERIKNAGFDFDFTQDNLTGYTFKATWTEAELSITLNVANTAEVTLYMNDFNGSKLSTQKDGTYKIHYNDTVAVKVNSDDWYKWTNTSIVGNVVSISGDITANNQANNKTDGQFVLNTIHSSLTITITIDAIDITFTTSYTKPIGADITEGSGDVSGVYDKDSGNTTLGQVIPYYTPEVGTYTQDYWENGDKQFTSDSPVEDVITSLYGSIPTEDISLALVAHFKGLTYTVTFEKGVPQEGKEAEFIGNDAGKDVVTRQWVYGSIISDIPEIYVEGQTHSWSNGSETYVNGSPFITDYPNKSCTMTITADWSNIKYNVQVFFSKNGNETQIINVLVDGSEYTEGQPIQTIFNTNKAFNFTLQTGYEVDALNTRILTDDSSGQGDYTKAKINTSGNIVTISEIHGNITAEVVIKAKDYTITIQKDNAENISQTTFDVSYDQSMTDFFAGVTFARDGYLVDSLKSGAQNFAVSSDGGNSWTFNAPFVQNGVYKNDGNLVLKAYWTSQKTYVTATTTPNNGLYFNGAKQTIANSTLKTLKGDETVVKGTTFANGDKVVDVYYMLDGTRYEIEADNSLLYRNVLDNKDVYIVVALHDTLLDGSDSITYTIQSEPQKITLSPSDITFNDTVLETYYSGTENFNITDNFSEGTWHYADGTQITELTYSKVVIVDGTGLYDVGNSYTVKYYFNATGEFDIANYTGLTAEGSYYTYTTSQVTGTIIQTPVTITVSGMGFENGENQEVISYDISKPDFVSNFDVEITKILTSESVANVYNTTDQFSITGTVKNGENDKTSNFVWVIAGSYTIVSSDEAYKVVTDVKYFDTKAITDKDDINISLIRYSYNGDTKTVSLDRDFFNLVVSDQLIFSVSSNGTNAPLIQVAIGQTITFTFEIDGTMAVLAWTENPQVDSLLSTLNVIDAEGSRQYSQEFTAETTVNAVLTDYKAVLLSLGDKGGDQGYIYVQLNGATAEAIVQDSWTGFEFARWDTDGSGVSAEGNTISAAADAKITTTTITAIWRLVAPTGNSNDEILRDAKSSYDGLIDPINLIHLLPNGITNKNNVITYSYSWQKGDEVLHSSEDGFTVLANTNSNGTYKLVVTASRSGYTSQSEEFEFTLTINKLTITNATLNTAQFTYANKDFVPDITVTFEGDKLGFDSVNLADMLNHKDNLPYYFTLAGISTTEIKNAGEYTLTLNLEPTIFNNYVYTPTVTVLRADLIISQDDVDAEGLDEKAFGENDPIFSFDRTMFEDGNPEVITITLVRNSGEGVGEYLFNSVSSSADENFNVTLNSDGVIFTIIPSDFTLNIKVDNVISMVYNGGNPTFTTEYSEEQGAWIIKVEDTSSTMTLSYTADDGERYLTGELYKLALNNVSFAMSTAIDVASYFGDSFEVTASEGSNFKTFTMTGQFDITQRPLTIEKVEKVFDRNNVINSQTTVAFSNLVHNDDVVLNGNYSQIVVGDQISLENLTLSGADGNNYYIVNHDFKGVITPLAVSNVVVGVNESAHIYGEINQNTLLQSFIDIVQGVTLSIEGDTNDLINGYATVSGWTVEEQYLSSSSNLKVGRDVVKIVISSDNFTGLAVDGYEVTLIIDKLELDLSTVAIVKNYDETTDMPKDLDTNIDDYIISGDIVSIDKDASKYADSGVGTAIKVTLVLKGDDSANYKVKDNVTGIINEYSITFIVNANTEDLALVSDGAFVDDGESPVITESSFSFKYPATMTSDEIIKAMRFPSRKGYTPVGWKYLEGDEYISITSDNVVALLKQIANDETNTTSQITIYTVWEIDRYDITVTGNNMESFEVTGTNVTGTSETGYTVRYFSDITISVVGERGYKVRAYNIAQGDNRGNDLSDVGNNTGVAFIEKVGSNVDFVVTFDEIVITINIDANIPDFTERTDKLSLVYNYNYSQLASLTKENLPALTVTAGTYTLTGYNYNDDVAINSETLQQIIDTLFPVLSTDVETTFKAVWTGENYKVTFDPQGGSLVGTNPINVVYGSAFEEAFPIAHISGKSNLWFAPDGTYYVDGEVFHSIGTVNTDGGYKITLTAEWHNNPYDLTLEFNDKLSITTSEGYVVTSGDEFEIIYEETSLVIMVTPDQGYIFDVVNKDTFNGDVLVEGNKVTISNLIEDGTLTLTSLPDDNTLSISINYIDGYKVKVDGVPYEKEDLSRIIAKTESEVEITFTAKKGYEFDEKSAYLTGNGDIETLISENKKTLTVTWKNFVDDATLITTGVPSDNIITIPDISDMFESLSLNGQNINVNGDTFTIKTAQTLTIIGSLCYGYENAVMTSTLPEGSIVSQLNTWVNADKAFSFSAVVDNIDENFEINFTVDERTYNFVVAVTEGQEEFGTIVSDANVTAQFNDQITLQENTIRNDYIFAGWTIADTILSVDSQFVLNIDNSIKNLLESFEHDTEIYIYATYKEKIFTVTFTTGNKGEYTFSQDGIDPVRVYGTNTVVKDLNLGSDIVITLKPDEGYEFDKVLIDEENATEDQFTFNEEDNIVTIPVPVNDPMTSIQITFKASEAYVSVQAGVQISYDVNLGSNEGGNVYIANAQGEIYDEESGLYLDNNGTLIFGADYKFMSYTDETIYFVAVPKSGFTAMMKCLNNQVIMREFDVGDVHVYSFSGVRDGMQVQAIFTAKENSVELKYVVEGSTDVVIGGKIVVDTSSAFVSASSNSTQNVTVGIITGADLIFTANSGIAYNLVANEDGTLKYNIVYQDEDTFEGVITAGQVNEADIITTGYSNTAEFSITGVNTSAIIYIYVQPKTYNLRFYVNENQSVVLNNALIYGEEFSIAGLSDEERSVIFQERSGFTLGGYFTKQLGQGKQYLDKDGNILSNWLEDGYTYNGLIYEPDTNFSVSENTFTIYAAWIYNKSSITINFIPDGFDNKLSTVEIDDIIVNINTTTIWTTQDNKWYAEVISGTSLKIQAYEYEGYEFKYWLISVDGGEPVVKASTFEMSFPQGKYVIEAVYYPKFSIEIENLQNGLAVGGTSSLIQNGVPVTSLSYDPTQQITLEAVAQEGYNFLYWENIETGEKIYGEFDKQTGKTTYVYENLISEPLYLKAVFEGKTVIVNLDYADVALHHEIVGVYVNGEMVEYDKPFTARVGDEISIEVIKHLGYGFNMQGGNFVQSASENGNIKFAYTLAVPELLAVDENVYKLDLVFTSTREEIKFTFNIYVEDAIDGAEASKAGKLTFIDINGKENDASENNLFSTPFGQTVYLKVESYANYEITRILLQIDLLNDITVLLDNGRIVIDENFMETYFAYNIDITVQYKRLVWTDEEYRSTALYGSGTESDPFLIQDAADMAFVAYVVNNGIVVGETNYADCYYKVVADIDFTGKYWEPIGTEENPFNGVMDIGGHQLYNILHYKNYSNPSTSYSGLFWHITENAQIIQNDYTLIIVLSVIGGIIFLLLLILIIILLIRRSKKNKLEEIANG